MSKSHSIPKPSVELKDDAASNYDIVKSHMSQSLPGINPNGSDILRYALHLAAQQCKLMGEPVVTELKPAVGGSE